MDLMRVPSWHVRRLGSIMESNLADPREVGGVLNLAVARGPDGQLYVLPRLVGAGNYSRIGLARVALNRSGDPVGVERLGVVLEPQAAYEINPWAGFGGNGSGPNTEAQWSLAASHRCERGPRRRVLMVMPRLNRGLNSWAAFVKKLSRDHEILVMLMALLA